MICCGGGCGCQVDGFGWCATRGASTTHVSPPLLHPCSAALLLPSPSIALVASSRIMQSPYAASSTRRRPYLSRVAKRPRTDSHSLLCLPDDVLLSIYSYLQGGTRIQGRVFSNARHAFSLAITNTRLLRIFQTTLVTIDALHPYPTHTFPPFLSPTYMPSHLASLVMLASHELKVLKLPRYEPGQLGAERILPVISHYCPNIQHLSFVDESRLDQALSRCLLKMSLLSLNISHPTHHVLQTLSEASLQSPLLTSLTNLSLSGIPGASLPQLRTCIYNCGHRLTDLSLHFDLFAKKVCETSSSWHTNHGPRTEVAQFLSHLATNLPVNFPNLHSLHVATLSNTELQHNTHHNTRLIAHGLGQIRRAILNMRVENQPYQSEGLVLKKLSVAASHKYMDMCLRRLQHLFSNHVSLDVHIPGFSLQFPPLSKKKLPVEVTRFQMSRSIQYCGSKLASMIVGLQTLNLGNDLMIKHYPEVRDDVHIMLKSARETLRRLVGHFSTDSDDVCIKALTYFADALIIADRIEYVEFGHELISKSEKHRAVFTNMVSQMQTVERIHLNSADKYYQNYDRGRCSYSERIERFARMLPETLELLHKNCDNLAVISMEQIGRVGNGNRKQVNRRRKMFRLALVALRRFEIDLPDVDVSALIEQVKGWIRQNDENALALQ